MRFQSLTVVSTVLMMALSTMAAPVLVNNLQNGLTTTNGGLIDVEARSHHSGSFVDPSKTASKFATEDDAAAAEGTEDPEAAETEPTAEDPASENTPAAPEDKSGAPIVNVDVKKVLGGNNGMKVGNGNGDVTYNGTPSGGQAAQAGQDGNPLSGVLSGLPLLN